ncbi:MAG: FAD-dependent oxidoreductase [Thiohalocapsa sp.]|jgi:predicted NAD/FAD-binding protein|uniref:NAD(P)/FAD-dependent oxidoreductase n=1 Tax=Thiohalocapsa sp. TaxID=2497641 RepID=UPI0025F176F8|nr:FAD-dependent oxidoreductase [Thiohalocapsa sp.]MCG6939754.1 FAD-dependent oxidoreductase [Thiohalocapsa sp.]
MTDRICVVGSGIAGLASAWLLSHRHQVTLVEKNGYFGGHTNTVEVDEGDRKVPVDTGFIVYNVRNYPLLVRLFERLGVGTRDSDMSFSASIGPGRLEYAGDSLSTIFAQRRNALSPRFLRMLVDIFRFNARCKQCLRDSGFDGRSLGEFLTSEGLSDAFRDHYLLPMASAIWSCPTDTMLAFPAESLARFFNNHRLLHPLERPVWRSVAGGSQRYVRRIAADLGPERMVSDAAVAVRRREAGVQVELASGRTIDADQVVLACHADQTLRLLAEPTADEARLLGRFRYQPNRTILHTDTNLMPRRRVVWSAWNYLAAENPDGGRAVSVTYWMNKLQGLETSRDYLVSLNPLIEPDPAKVIAETTYDHPVFDQAAMNAQRELHRIQGVDRLYFCGSYFGYGFHEDALRSAVDVAERLGVDTGWLTGNDELPAAVGPLAEPAPAGAPA